MKMAPEGPVISKIVVRFQCGSGSVTPNLRRLSWQILSLLCLPFHHAAGRKRSRSACARCRILPDLRFSGALFRMRPRSVHRSEPRRRLALQRTPPDDFPVLPADVGYAAVALIELIGNLKHRQHQPTLGRPGHMAAAALAPNEFAGLDLEPGGGAFLVDELALE